MTTKHSNIRPSNALNRPPVVQPASSNAIIVNPCQRLNPVLEHIRNVAKEFGDIVPDFRLGLTTCALFLSLKYHRLHPEYIHQRIQKLGNSFTLRLLLLMCDISEHQDPIRELTKICLVNNITIIVCWSNEEAGTYLATYKAFEHKSPDIIKERVDKEYNAVLRSALTSINKVNKTDVESLRTSFGSFAKIAHSSPEQLRRLPGFGQVKVRRIVDAFEKPFRNKATSAPAPLVTSSREGPEEVIEKRDERNGQYATQGTKPSEFALSEKPPPEAPGETSSSNDVPILSAPKGIHQYGSAADMRPLTSSSLEPNMTRELSPPWDIELDLNEDE